jgi:ATP-dependent Lon protease
MFICTANLTDTIQAAFPRPHGGDPPLRLHRGGEDRDRQAPHRAKQLEEHGITPENLLLTDKALRSIINSYTREAGLRNVEREIASISRKVARKVAEGLATTTKITPANLPKFLGARRSCPRRS